ncbi:MAG: tetratricopeptide repeat protein [Candidatus Omnitrophica bacterium]|nr:tetratricopeptide repeat protein [Candidatus Omnitrophota bacterium]
MISKFKKYSSIFQYSVIFLCLTMDCPVYAQDNPVDVTDKIVNESWAASSQRQEEKVNELVGQCVERYQEQAKVLQNSLTAFPNMTEARKYQPLNDIGTCLFIQAEYVMNSGKKEEAITKFQSIIDNYSWAQSWDPRTGAFWSIAEKSRQSIDAMLGKEDVEVDETKDVLRTVPVLFTKGTEDVVDYTKYGQFMNVGTENYIYRMTDIEGLKKAVGEGIYPNIGDIYKNPGYKKAKAEGRLNGSHWDFVNQEDLEAAYYKWFIAPEPWGVRLFYLGFIFERAGMYDEALKAYQALVVHYPKTIGYTYWQTPWYPGQAAIAKIRHILRTHPELNLEDDGMRIIVKKGFDNDIKNDKIITSPGKIFKRKTGAKADKLYAKSKRVKLDKIVETKGDGIVQLVKFDNGHWQLRVNGKPYIIKGITYDPTKIGQSPDKGTLQNWMEEDTNGNGLADGPFEAYVDANHNNKRDGKEKVVGDFKIMKDMGVNTIRFYHIPTTPNKEVLRKLYKDYGIRVILGDFLGKYAIGSGATWVEGTDYENEEHKKNMLEKVKQMVMEHKDEPYVLMWLLGNENNYGVACNADKKPAAYFRFADEVAQWIKSVDKNHPIALGNGDTLFLDIFAENTPNIDIFAGNVYRGDYGFGSLWEQVSDATNNSKPAFITEYGAPSFAKHLNTEQAEKAQADYHLGNWQDIYENSAGQARGVGNSIGGVAFEYLDEWWKNYEPFRHDKKSDAVGPFPGGYYYEEWFGLVGQGNGQDSPFLRQPRKSYYLYKELWSKDK